MNSVLEVKKSLCILLGVDTSNITEDSDIIIPINLIKYNTSKKAPAREHDSFTIDNKTLHDAFISLTTKNIKDLQLYSDTSYEVAVTCNRKPIAQKLEDTVNKIEYLLSDASLEYILLICNIISTNTNEYIGAIIEYNKKFPFHEIPSVEQFIAKTFRIQTIKIEAKEPTKLQTFTQFCASYEYLYMYKMRASIMKVINISNLYGIRISGGILAKANRFDEAPRRTVNQDTLEYYAMAIDSYDPFTAYISFYHVLEYYFVEVYKKNLLYEMKNRLTNPDFSYKNDTKLYELATWIGNKMKNDDRDGRGNELASLKYVLEEYVSIESLIKALDEWDPDLKKYYQTESVSFSGNSKDKIIWSTPEGVYTNLANRIYSTRNALVHSKSDKLQKQYRPLKHKDCLLKEIPLIQVLSEIIIFKDGNPL